MAKQTALESMSFLGTFSKKAAPPPSSLNIIIPEKMPGDRATERPSDRATERAIERSSDRAFVGSPATAHSVGICLILICSLAYTMHLPAHIDHCQNRRWNLMVISSAESPSSSVSIAPSFFLLAVLDNIAIFTCCAQLWTCSTAITHSPSAEPA